MARSTEVIRQWEILREIDGARTGITIAKLAALRNVHVRTIRRDVDALGRAGFPLTMRRSMARRCGSCGDGRFTGSRTRG